MIGIPNLDFVPRRAKVAWLIDVVCWASLGFGGGWLLHTYIP
jgi:hypothetical protein